MTVKNDGGPAFPRSYNNGTPIEAGMSLRDWFAGQAMAGLLADGMINKLAKVFGHSFTEDQLAGEAARYSYLVADAMLAARENNNG